MKTTKRPGVDDAKVRKTTRVNVRLDSEAARRLRVHCAMTELTPGEVLTRLCEGLREFSMPAKLTDRPDKSHRQTPSDLVSDSAPPPALQDAA